MSCRCGCTCGGQNPVNVQDAEVIAQFQKGIQKLNATNNSHLEFKRIISATQQVVKGFIFRGVVEVAENGANKHYNIQIYAKPGGEVEVSNFALVQ